MTRRRHAERLLTEAMDLLSSIQTVLHAATIDQQVTIAEASQITYGPDREGEHYNRLTHTVTDLRDRIHDHLEN